MISKHLTAATAAIAAIFGSLASNVHGHGHLVSPRSRNYVANPNPQNGPWSSSSTTPYPEYCPHCLNIGGTEARCGKIDSRNYDHPKNALGGDLAPNIQACYAQGDVVKLDVILTAHHMGHFSYKACAINPGEVASQECFDRNPLTFVEDVLYGSRPDPNYPNRAYIPRADARFIQKDSKGHYKFSHRFRLPQGLSGDLVLLQWHYITGNSCLPDNGYLTYNFPEGFRPNLQLGVCSSMPPNGGVVPEQFWNCAEVRIARDCSSSSNPPPPPSPTNPGGGGSPPSPSSGTCGNGNRGNGVCADGTCCSEYGWCGTSAEHCSGGGGGSSGGIPPSPSSGTCGNGNRGNGICADGTCCSEYGWCGTSTEHCSGGGGGGSSGGSPPSPSPPNPTPTPTGRGEWETCTSSNQCGNQCCSGKYSDGVLKCTPVGGFKTSEGCVGSSTSTSTSNLGDWELCTNSNQCGNQCCSGKYSGGVLKCTPVGGFKTSEGCVGSATRHLRGNNEDEVLGTFTDETSGDAASVDELGSGSGSGNDVEYEYGDGNQLN